MYPVTIGPVVDIQFQLGVQDSVAALPPSSAFSQFAVQRPNVTSITPNRCLHAGRYRARHGIIGVLFQLDFLFLCVYEQWGWDENMSADSAALQRGFCGKSVVPITMQAKQIIHWIVFLTRSKCS